MRAVVSRISQLVTNNNISLSFTGMICKERLLDEDSKRMSMWPNIETRKKMVSRILTNTVSKRPSMILSI